MKQWQWRIIILVALVSVGCTEKKDEPKGDRPLSDAVLKVLQEKFAMSVVVDSLRSGSGAIEYFVAQPEAYKRFLSRMDKGVIVEIFATTDKEQPFVGFILFALPSEKIAPFAIDVAINPGNEQAIEQAKALVEESYDVQSLSEDDKLYTLGLHDLARKGDMLKVMVHVQKAPDGSMDYQIRYGLLRGSEKSPEEGGEQKDKPHESLEVKPII